MKRVVEFDSDGDSDGEVPIAIVKPKRLRVPNEDNHHEVVSDDVRDEANDYDAYELNRYTYELLEEHRPQPQHNREDRLNTSLFTTDTAKKSIGQAMMEKMGYRVGDGLGKNGAATPIAVEVKSDKHGIGADSLDIDTYRARRSDENHKQHMEIQLDKITKFCQEQSRDEAGAGGSDVTWDSVVELLSLATDDDDKLLVMLEYLRSKFYWCWYCGYSFANKDDLEDSCPGITEEDHAGIKHLSKKS